MLAIKLETVATMLGILAIATAPCTAQEQEDRTRNQRIRPDEQREIENQRAGGIPREQVMQKENEEEDGIEEGMPEIRMQRDRDARQRGDQRAEDARTQETRPNIQVVPRYNPQWKLGVYAYNTQTGVVITRVVPNSAAWNAGLERGDRIVAVDGYQIGWVGDRLYPLGAELQRQANHYGAVELLLQNVRNDELLVREVQLDGQRRHRAARPEIDR